VGASWGSILDRQRATFSSFGSRVDAEGWGWNVETTGFGSSYINPADPMNRNFWYDLSFNGTSSAAAIVAGAIADLQGMALKGFGAPFSPAEIRMLLATTGNPQLGNMSENIGPLPSLWTAIRQLTTIVNPLLPAAIVEPLPVYRMIEPFLENGNFEWFVELLIEKSRKGFFQLRRAAVP